MKRIKVIACEVLTREISLLCETSGCRADVVFLRQGLHDTPELLRKELQREIDVANRGFLEDGENSPAMYDAIVLGYCLCCNGTVNLTSEMVPLVIPRGHDCITLLLGSKEKYSEWFRANPGTFWYSAGWIEHANQPGKELYERTFKEYAEKYGEDNAEYLMQLSEEWLKDYNTAVYIDWPCLDKSAEYRSVTRNAAEYMNWQYKEITGDSGLLSRILNGVFNEDEVLIVTPGKRTAPSNDEKILKVID